MIEAIYNENINQTIGSLIDSLKLNGVQLMDEDVIALANRFNFLDNLHKQKVCHYLMEQSKHIRELDYSLEEYDSLDILEQLAKDNDVSFYTDDERVILTYEDKDYKIFGYKNALDYLNENLLNNDPITTTSFDIQMKDLSNYYKNEFINSDYALELVKNKDNSLNEYMSKILNVSTVGIDSFQGKETLNKFAAIDKTGVTKATSH
jgi:predicted nucleic acid-binding protein